MDYKNFSAKTVDEAITKACLELGVTSDRLDYEVMSEGSNGFLGIGSKPASIKARKRSEEELAREAAAIEAAEKAAAQSVVFVQEKKPEKKEEKKVVTSDEIEKRAALAAAKAKEEGIYPESSENGKRTDREAPRNGRRHDDRRDGKFESRRDSRHDDKRNGKYDSRRNSHDRRSGYVPEETVTADEKPHKPSQPKPDRVISPKTDEEVEKMREEYDFRRKYCVRKLNEMGLPTFEPKGAFYVFPNISASGMTSEQFCMKLLEEKQVAIVPGTAFGASGEGFARISYAYSLDHLQTAMKRINEFLVENGINKGEK